MILGEGDILGVRLHLLAPKPDWCDSEHLNGIEDKSYIQFFINAVPQDK